MVVSLAKVQPGAIRYERGNITDTWLGVLSLTDGTTTHAIIKDIPHKEIANELIGATLAEAIGLPVPDIFLACAGPNDLPATKAPETSNGYVLFASDRKGAPPLKQFWTGAIIPDKYRDILASWSHCGSVFAYDTWTANIDRNVGNLLVGGPDDIWLIDHGQINTGPDWKPVDLVANSEFTNKMASWLTPHFSRQEKIKLLSGITSLTDAVRDMDLKAIAESSKALSFLTEKDGAAMLAFLKDRVDHIPAIASKQANTVRIIV